MIFLLWTIKLFEFEFEFELQTSSTGGGGGGGQRCVLYEK